MKKKLPNLIPLSKSGIKKLLLTMKIALIIVFLSVLQVSANVYSQITVNLDVQDKSIREVLKIIEQQSQVRFFYSDDLLSMNELIDVKADNKNILGVLDDIFSKSPLTYKAYENNLIVIAPRELLQQQKVTGTIADKNGAPIPGANVVVTGTTQGTMTDVAGKYRIDVPQGARSLTFSFIGMEPQEISIGTLTQINVTMSELAIGLEEVVVIGYGTVKKANLTTAIVQYKPTNVIERGLPNIENALAGQLAGVQVQSSTGMLGSDMKINIRGISTISGGQNALVVIDGFPGGSLQNLNPNDIETIEVLKDAAAAAIYGSRASNGVILVTTKRGVAGEAHLSFSLTRSLQTIEKKVDLLNRDELIGLMQDGKPRLYDPLWDSDPQSLPDTDWQDMMFRTAPITNIEMGASGGNEKVLYRISAGVLDQDGILIETNYKKFNLRSNIDIKVSDKIKLGFNVSSDYSISKGLNTLEGKEATGTTHYTPGILKLMLNLYPFQSPEENFVEPSNYYPYIQDDFDVFTNPVYRMEHEKQSSSNLNVNTFGFFEFEIIKGLTFRSSIGANMLDYGNNSFYPITMGNQTDAEGSKLDRKSYKYVADNTITFEQSINENHKLSGLAGLSFEKYHREDFASSKLTWNDESIIVLNGGAYPNDVTGTIGENALISYLGRLNYSFKNKYLIGASIRRDGASQFAPDKKWGLFPSISGAWRVSEETFLKNTSFISDLKVRISYGKTGNNSLSDYAWQSTAVALPYVFGINETPYSLYRKGSVSDMNLGWEKTSTFNIGVDFGIFKNRITGAFDYYGANTTDLLLNVPLPTITGSNSVLTNTGELKNTGLEIELSSLIVSRSRFNWRMNINFSHNKNEILKLGPNNEPILTGKSGTSNISTVGYPVSSYYLFVIDGVISSADIAAGYPQYGTQKPGDYKFVDINKDGVINGDDRSIVGHNNPDFIWGWSNDFSYGPFKLNFLLQGVVGNHVFLNMGREIDAGRLVSNQLAHWANRWRSDEYPGDGLTPSVNCANARTFGTQWLFKGDFWRIRSVSLNYTLPGKISNKLYIDQMSIFASGENLFTKSEYPLWNPEVRTVSSSGEGLDYGGYPLARMFSVGIRIQF